jgi:hypothetical protein
MAKVNRQGPVVRKELGACWLWTGFVKDNGYGQFGRGAFDGVYAHRFSYELHAGPVPAGLFVLHRCDVRNCVNPDHLFVGTAKDNADDRDAKGRLVTPFVPGYGRVTDQDTDAIRAARSGGEALKVIAERFGISAGYAGAIARRTKQRAS